ncbi:hypothetical protein A2U01_0026729 [Trifolium medium]|uniref:Uncharacterized protein n=1 Tax=Trifolium medium TaxID=97028 RepID=A0A392P2U7_9FABA|nr:hypothetical protein [Trifolium medium]
MPGADVVTHGQSRPSSRSFLTGPGSHQGVSEKVHNTATSLNDRSFLVKEDVKMLSTNLSIASEEEVIVRKRIAHLEGELRLLQKRKRELDESISNDVFKLITKFPPGIGGSYAVHGRSPG